MNYYIYVNWGNKIKEKFIVHHWSCGHCRMGLGKHNLEKTKQGGNGVWVGPFITKELGMEFSKKYFPEKKVGDCKHCKNK